MAALMQPFISETIRVITEALRAPAHCESETAPHVSATRHRLDASIAETVSNGSVIFRHPGGESEPDWCVLAHSGVASSNDLQFFRLRGRLGAAMKPEEFVQKAYEFILLRKVDLGGQKSYVPQLQSRALTRRDLIKILVESSEAKALKDKLVIVPEPSSSLSDLELIRGNDSAFHLLTVRMPPQSSR